jgi:hypothetical protein
MVPTMLSLPPPCSYARFDSRMFSITGEVPCPLRVVALVAPTSPHMLYTQSSTIWGSTPFVMLRAVLAHVVAP